MGHPLEILLPPPIGAELIYSFVIIICSLLVYYSTREMYELSSYKGIKYFRQAFLFFAIAYFFRYFIQFFLFFFNVRHILEFSPRYVGWISLFVFLYASSMAIFFLLYSVMWKRWNHSTSKIVLFNLFALIIALLGSSLRGIGVWLILNFILLAFVSFVLLVAYKDHKARHGRSGLFIIYLLLFIFWILNILDILIPEFLQVYQLVIYLISIFLFMIILYRVLKKAGN